MFNLSCSILTSSGVEMFDRSETVVSLDKVTVYRWLLRARSTFFKHTNYLLSMG